MILELLKETVKSEAAQCSFSNENSGISSNRSNNADFGLCSFLKMTAGDRLKHIKTLVANEGKIAQRVNTILETEWH